MTTTQTASQDISTNTVLVYVHDPMCSWCYGFRPTWIGLRAILPPSLSVVALVGGLAPDSDEPMPIELAEHLAATWSRVASVCGVPMNLEYWSQVPPPPRTTYPACRAVIAAEQIAGRGEVMTARIQDAYYQEAQNVWRDEVLVRLATEIGFSAEAFAQALTAEAVSTQHAEQRALAERLGVSGYPSLLLIHDGQGIPIPVRHGAPDQMAIEISEVLGLSHPTH
ncbi:MAG: DsbA family protein [Litorivicinaceae bacterium]